MLTAFASPRRLAAHITAVAQRAADKHQTLKLMPVTVGLDGGALEGLRGDPATAEAADLLAQRIGR